MAWPALHLQLTVCLTALITTHWSVSNHAACRDRGTGYLYIKGKPKPYIKWNLQPTDMSPIAWPPCHPAKTKTNYYIW